MKPTLLLLLVFSSIIPCSAQWHPTEPLAESPVRTVAIRPDGGKGEAIFVGREDGHFSVSTDQGRTWTLGTIPAGWICSFAFPGSSILAGTSNGVFRSTDDGLNWSLVSAQVGAYPVASIGTVFVAGSQDGILRSTDEGRSWSFVDSGITVSIPNWSGCSITSFARIGANLFAGAYNGGVFRSTNGGLSWSWIGGPLYTQSLVADSSNLYAGGIYGLQRSSDGGLTWINAGAGLSGGIFALACIGQNVYAGTYQENVYSERFEGGVFVSTNQGVSWTPMDTGFAEGYRISSLTLSGKDLYAGTEIGLFSWQDDSAHWSRINTGGFQAPVYSLASHGSTLLAGSTLGAIFRSTDAGTHWSNVRTWSQSVRCLIASGADLFAGVYLNPINRSTDDGRSWTPIPYPPSPLGAHSLAVRDSTMFAGGDAGDIYRSTDNGVTWTTLTTSLPRYPVAALATNGSNVFAGVYGGGAFRSDKNGITWKSINVGLGNYFVTSLAVSGGTLIGGTAFDGGIFLSDDNGTSWRTGNNGLVNHSVNCLLLKGTALFAGTDGGIFLSTDAGTSWTSVSEGLVGSPVISLTVAGNILAAGTESGGIWTRPLSEITSVQVTSNYLPTESSLGQNYPNPFNPSTTIRYALPHRSHVTLTIFSTLGQLVATLVNGEMDAGYHTVQFNGSKLASGVYFYRLQADSFVDAKKLLLVR